MIQQNDNSVNLNVINTKSIKTNIGSINFHTPTIYGNFDPFQFKEDFVKIIKPLNIICQIEIQYVVEQHNLTLIVSDCFTDEQMKKIEQSVNVLLNYTGKYNRPPICQFIYKNYLNFNDIYI